MGDWSGSQFEKPNSGDYWQDGHVSDGKNLMVLVGASLIVGLICFLAGVVWGERLTPAPSSAKEVKQLQAEKEACQTQLKRLRQMINSYLEQTKLENDSLLREKRAVEFKAKLDEIQ